MALTIGQIIWWDSPSIPEGFGICDGGIHDGIQTPDMRDKFQYGASSDSDNGTTGGTTTHSHSGSTDSGGSSHDHGGSYTGSTNTQNASKSIGSNTPSSSVAAGHSHAVSVSIGSGGSSHSHTATIGSSNHLPPYVKVYCIMRTK